MSDKDNGKISKAVTREGRRWNWLAWTFPVLVIGIAAWIVYSSMPRSSGTITLRIDRADDITANNTLVFHRGVRVGLVSGVTLDSELETVELQIELDEGKQAFARAGARYWLVRPDLKNGSLQSLSTIVSGPEIHAEPGNGEASYSFTTSEPPLPGVGPQDLVLQLETPTRQNFARGTPLSYRGLNTGVVTGVNIAPDASRILLTLNIFDEYAHLVRSNSIFWNSGGLEIDFSIFTGADINSSSLGSLFGGEISFATPEEPAPRAQNGDVFQLRDEIDRKWEQWQPAFETRIQIQDTDATEQQSRPPGEAEGMLQSTTGNASGGN